MSENLRQKILTQPHPWFGTSSLRLYHKSAAASMVELTEGEKQMLFPSPSWADNRRVKMVKSQLQQALTGNLMLPGEEHMRRDMLLQVAAPYEEMKFPRFYQSLTVGRLEP